MELIREKEELKKVYTDLLIEYGTKDERIVTVEADLSRSAGTLRFKEFFPKRWFSVGIAEANMISFAAGLSSMGKIPFTQTFSIFASHRALDQIWMSIAYSKLNVKMCGTDPGITTELNGGTHQALDDIGIMRSIPTMTIFEPVDEEQLKQIFPQILEEYGPAYIRLFRQKPYKIFDSSYKFTLGKGTIVKEGKDVTLIASGIMVAETLKAYDLLAKQGISAEVINIHTIKPLDTDIISKSVKKTGCVVTVENGSIINGLGSAVSEYLSENIPVPLKRIGVKDRFGEIGTLAELIVEYKMSDADIVNAAKDVIQRRGDN